MHVAFSRSFVRFSGLLCVVFTSLNPVSGQNASLAIVQTVPADVESVSSPVAENLPAAEPEQNDINLPYVDLSDSDESTLLIRADAAAESSKFSNEHVAVLPQSDVESQRPGAGARSENTNPMRPVYHFLDYVPMSCDDAFEPSDGAAFEFLFAASTVIRVNDAIQVNDAIPADEATVPPSDSEQASVAVADSKANAEPIERAPRRSMSEITLSTSLTNLSDTGEPLPTPEEFQDSSDGAAPLEHHFVPAPWERSHPSRNTYQIRYQPLYFEDPNMERCGDSNGLLTEATSIVHFATRIPLLPYLTASNSPHKCVNALPDCPTCSEFGTDAYLPRPTVKAIAAQAAATVAGVYIIP